MSCFDDTDRNVHGHALIRFGPFLSARRGPQRSSQQHTCGLEPRDAEVSPPLPA